jgi:ATP-dependent DNA helicase RecG
MSKVPARDSGSEPARGRERGDCPQFREYNQIVAALSSEASATSLCPDMPVQYIKGIGPRRSAQLAAHGIETVADLLEYAPFRYEDRSSFRPLASLREGEWVLTRGTICSLGGFQTRKRNMTVVEILVEDETGGMVLKFFNQPYLRQVYRVGSQLVIYGQVKRDGFKRGALGFMNPECELLDKETTSPIHSGRVVPIYRKLEDLRTRTLRRVLHDLVSRLPSPGPDTLPSYLRKQLRLLPRQRAVLQIHFPELRSTEPEARAGEMEMLNRGLSPAHKRLIFEELFHLQVGLRMLRDRRVYLRKERHLVIGDSVRQTIKKILPYHPTGAQKRVLKEIAEDMCSDKPMSRLLQGDVGSGKTIVAAQAAIIAIENGYQAALMAPTEILAEQHYFNFRRLLAPVGFRVDLVTGSLGAKEKRAALARIREGETKIAIGTHALIQQGVEFRDLALAVIDEQHRFGVLQRNILKERGNHPDVLVMTATPIPRSLALTLYGDLDVSVIDEMPPGRKPIITSWCGEKDRAQVYEAIRSAVSDGRQAYVVYPLVEESEKTDLRAATEMAEHLRTRVFSQFRVGLLHGRMKGPEKERIMTSFAAGELQILVATTVIEVGVDVANATLMVIEHAERFGLAQLHQLRGRVGRGAAQSMCLLIGDAKENPESRRRLEIMCETNDGFRIAEVDLELRGPGEIAGTRQSGIPAFKYANLIRDRRALQIARDEADRFLDALQKRPTEELQRIAALIQSQWQGRFGLALVG